MILSFKHKGLEALYRKDSAKGVRADHVKKLRRILTLLDAAQCANDMRLPGYALHELKGSMKNVWAVTVNGNWRVAWKFREADVEIVDYLDYH